MHAARVIIAAIALSAAIAQAADPATLVQSLQIPATREQAHRDLLAMGDHATPAIVAGLSTTDAQARYDLIGLLGQIRSPQAIAPLVKIAQGNDRDEASAALRALGQIGGPEAAEAIIAALPQLHPTGQADYCRVLSAIGDNRAIEPLARLLANREPQSNMLDGETLFRNRTRQAAAEALGYFRDPRARAALNDAIRSDPNWEVYHAARQALWRMDSAESYPDYERLRTLVDLAVSKHPEPPEGAEEYIRTWHKEHPNWQGAWAGPSLQDYAAKADIERAREAVIESGRTSSSDLRAGGVVELLMEYLCNRKLYIGPENAKALLIEIGKPAIPAFENGAKRGDRILSRNCRECIEAIRVAGASTP